MVYICSSCHVMWKCVSISFLQNICLSNCLKIKLMWVEKHFCHISELFFPSSCFRYELFWTRDLLAVITTAPPWRPIFLVFNFKLHIKQINGNTASINIFSTAHLLRTGARISLFFVQQIVLIYATVASLMFWSQNLKANLAVPLPEPH